VIKIKNLAEMLCDAQVHMIDKTVFVNPKKNEYIYFLDMYEDDFESDFKEECYNSPEWVKVETDSFSRDMYLEFIYSQEEQLHPELLNVFSGSGKYSRIKNRFAIKGLLEEFYKFELEYTSKLAIEWCEEHNLKYIE
jgi:hypothetical protein